MSSVFIALEGFQVGKCFVLKELHLLITDDEFKHFVFSAPDITLDNKEQKTVRYCTRYLHGISWSAGDIPYDAIDGILRKYQTCTIYCYGYTSAGFLQKMLPTTVVVDVQKEGYVMPKTIPTKQCFIVHNSRHCARSKAHAIRSYVLNVHSNIDVE